MTTLSPTPPGPMTAAEFLDWAEAQSDAKFELHNGRVLAMAYETRRHAIVKMNAARAFDDVPDPCQAYVDGIGVIAAEDTAFIPDVVVDCGDQSDLDALTADKPVVVVEVLSDSTWRYDIGVKASGYFKVDSIRHYLLIDGKERRVIHHSRTDGGVMTAIVTGGSLFLDPPGIAVDIDEFWRGLPAPTP